jgi:hypothetical protein
MIEDRRYRRPRGGNVTPHSPAMASRIAPLIDVVLTPRTLRILNRAICGKKSVAHSFVTLKGF